MSQALRIFGIIVVFGLTSTAWLILGGVTTARSKIQSGALGDDVAELWGREQQQRAPSLTVLWNTYEDQERTETVDGKVKLVRSRKKVPHSKEVFPSASALSVDLTLDQRLKGLMWYSLYDVALAGEWSYEHREPVAGVLQVAFAFPDTQGLYDKFRLIIDDVDYARSVRPQEGQLTTTVPIKNGQRVKIVSGYTSRGMDAWRYLPGVGVASLENFRLVMTTDFSDIDFPAYTMSPSSKERRGTGWQLTWDFSRVVTGHGIGVVMPKNIQPGELAASLSFSAPISLFFFFLILFVLSTLKGIDIHPVNYLLLAGSFFAFHLFFSYSVDHIHLVPAFVASSVISMLLVTTYVRLVVSKRFAFVEVALAQLVYLIGFSLAYFWEGYTGLTVTVLSIITLFVLMQLTGRLNWSEVLGRKPTRGGPPPAPM